MSANLAFLCLLLGELPLGSPITDPAYPMPAIGMGNDDDPVAALNTPTVLFVNFDGPYMNGGCGNDSRNDCSWLFQGQFTPYPGDDAAKAGVVQATRADVEDFGVIVVGERPTMGDYAMVVVGTPPGGAPPGVGGVAPTIDCGNTFPSTTSFAFNVGSGPNGIATVIHQEAAHTWGLEHVDDGSDNLFPTTSGAQDPKYTDECHRVVSNVDLDPTSSQCNSIHTMFCESNFQNSYQEMLLLFGPPIPDTVPPTISIDAPLDGQTVGFEDDFELTITIDDERRPQIIDAIIYFDDTEAADATLVNATHTFPVNGGPAPGGHGLTNGMHTIRVDITDESGNPASDQVTIMIDGAPEDNGDSSGGGESGGEEEAGDEEDAGDADAGDDSDSDTDGVPETGSTTDRGCNCRSGGPADLLLLLLLPAFRRRASRRRTSPS